MLLLISLGAVVLTAAAVVVVVVVAAAAAAAAVVVAAVVRLGSHLWHSMGKLQMVRTLCLYECGVVELCVVSNSVGLVG